MDVVVNAKKEQVHAQIRVKNDGGIDGAEVVQLYLSFPNHVGEPPKVLRGFEKVFIKSGRQSTVQFELGKTELSIWDIVSQSWVIPQGEFRIHIGASSRDIRQTFAFVL